MSTDEKQPARMGPAKATGRRYASVKELMGESSVEVRAKLDEFRAETRIVFQLAKVRQSAGITQEAMATHLGVTQSAISKLESGPDEDITLRHIREYSRATGQRLSVMFGKPYNHVEAVKMHAYGIKYRLEQLAAIANQNQELDKDIKAFFGEAFFNLLNILETCSDKLPRGGVEFEVKMEICDGKPMKTRKELVVA